MKLSTLAEYFERLDALTSRNALIEVMGELFAETHDPAEVRTLVYMAEGILLPPYEATEIGISEELMARAISQATGESVEAVKALYKEIGDYGSVAERLMTDTGEGLSIIAVYDSLLSIARLTGKGSIEARVEGLAELVRKMSPREARYVLRIPIGKLRLGIGDPTIMDGLALAYDVSRDLIESAYNLCGDMGTVAYLLVAEGPERLVNFRVRPGTPIRVELAQRTATLDEMLRRLGTCAVEPKYDGFRCQVHKMRESIRVFTRNLEDATDMFPEIVHAACGMHAESAIIEGEAVSYDPETGEFRPFQVTVQRKRKHAVEAKERELPLVLMAFDCLYCDGVETMYEPYTKRRETLLSIIPEGRVIQVTESAIAESPEDVETFFEHALSEGLEGVMAKSLASPYRAGRRTYDWIKLKPSYRGGMRDTVDCVIVGYYAGRGKRAKWGIGSLLCAVYDPENDRFLTVTRVASGLPDQGWIDMKATLDEIKVDDKPARVVSAYHPDFWVEPRYVTEILADEITKSPKHTAGFALRFPRIVTPIRTDRRPEDATTVDEMRKLYEIQYQKAA